MEPFEWLIFGIGLTAGSLIGARRKNMVKSAAKAYLRLQQGSHALTAGMRADSHKMRTGLHKMLAGARQERDRETALRTEPMSRHRSQPPVPKPGNHTARPAPGQSRTRPAAAAQSKAGAAP